MTQEQWEALKPGDRLRAIRGRDIVEVVGPVRFYHIKGDGCGANTYASDPDSWELIKPEPMNWHDAMKAVTEGKIVRSESCNIELSYGEGVDMIWQTLISTGRTQGYVPARSDMEATDWEVA